MVVAHIDTFFFLFVLQLHDNTDFYMSPLFYSRVALDSIIHSYKKGRDGNAVSPKIYLSIKETAQHLKNHGLGSFSVKFRRTVIFLL